MRVCHTCTPFHDRWAIIIITQQKISQSEIKEKFLEMNTCYLFGSVTLMPSVRCSRRKENCCHYFDETKPKYVTRCWRMGLDTVTTLLTPIVLHQLHTANSLREFKDKTWREEVVFPHQRIKFTDVRTDNYSDDEH